MSGAELSFPPWVFLCLILWIFTGVSTAVARIEIDEDETLTVSSLIRYVASAVLITTFWPWVVWANFLRNKVFK